MEHYPSKVEVRVAMDGTGQATQAGLRTVGVPISSGHNLLAVAEAADLFGEGFQSVLATDHDAVRCETFAANWAKWCCGAGVIQLYSRQPNRCA